MNWNGQKNTGWAKLPMGELKALNRPILSVKKAEFSMSTFIIHRRFMAPGQGRN